MLKVELIFGQFNFFSYLCNMKKQVKVEFAKESHKLQLDLFDDGENVSRIVSVVRSDGVIYGDAFKTMYDKDRRKGYGRYLLEYFLKYIKENYKGMTLLIRRLSLKK